MPESPSPDFSFESRLHDQGFPIVAGIDEAGRGPWAGPVAAAAVVLRPEGTKLPLNDSKKLSELKREELFDQIYAHGDVGVGLADVAEIDELNILNATYLAMSRAVASLSTAPDAALVDGNRAPDLGCPTQTVIKGDGRSLSIAAASIIAKVTRDRIMRDLAKTHPAYGWERNKGYGTKVHQEALASDGVTQHHRRSFAPIHKILYEDSSLTN